MREGETTHAWMITNIKNHAELSLVMTQRNYQDMAIGRLRGIIGRVVAHIDTQQRDIASHASKVGSSDEWFRGFHQKGEQDARQEHEWAMELYEQLLELQNDLHSTLGR